IAAEMAGNMQLRAFSLEQELGKRRIADAEGGSLETRAVCGGERAADMLVIDDAHPRKAMGWEPKAGVGVTCPIGARSIQQGPEFVIGSGRRERAVDGERPRGGGRCH